MGDEAGKKRQAIILIHGIGEQRPMETALNFARSIAQAEDIRIKPTSIGVKGEMQRITIKENRNRPRTDIYEYYWAHKFRTNRLSTINRWMAAVLFQTLFSQRTPGFLRKRLEFIVLSLLALALPVLYCLFVYYCHVHYGVSGMLAVVGLSYLGYKLILSDILYGYIADAAKYLSNHPDNISAREEVRNDGLHLLNDIVATGSYNRIMIVGHSLGSVIGYDILQMGWARFIENIEAHIESRDFIKDEFIKLKDMASKITGRRDADKFQKAQRLLRQRLAECGVDWLVSDLVTVGSPLSFANFLLARNQADFVQKADTYHLLLKCPPHGAVEDVTFSRTVTLRSGRKHNCYYPTYNSLFLFTSWTNIFFGTDPVGGPVQALFGQGVIDVPLKKGVYGLSHVKYFVVGSKASRCIRNALKLETKLVRTAVQKATPAPAPGPKQAAPVKPEPLLKNG